MLPILIAQAAADASAGSSGAWMVGLMTAGSGATGLVGIISLFATRREQAAMEKRLDKVEEIQAGIMTEIAEMERRLNTASENRAVATHDRINDVLEAVSEIRGELKSHHTR